MSGVINTIAARLIMRWQQLKQAIAARFNRPPASSSDTKEDAPDQ